MFSTIISKNSFSYTHHKNVYSNTHINLAMEIVLVTNGEINVEINDTKYSVKKNQVIFIMPFEDHNFETVENSECFIIMFSDENLKTFIDVFKNKLPSPRKIDCAVELVNWLNYKMNKKDKINGLEISCILNPIFCEIKEKCKILEDKPLFNNFFLSALSVINNNISDEITLESVSSEIGVHPVTLSKAFKKHAGMTFVEYVNYRRIIYAERKILKGDKSIDVALEVGFGSVRNFNREFKKYFKMSPSEYKISKNIT